MEPKTLSKKCKSSCSVPQCKIKQYSSLHKLPKDKNLRKKWIIMCRIGKVTANTLICRAHFNDNDFIPALNPKRRQLKSYAFPSMNLPMRPLDKILTPLQESAKTERAKRVEMREREKQNKESATRADNEENEEKIEEATQESVYSSDTCEHSAENNTSLNVERDDLFDNSALDMECDDPYHQNINNDATQDIEAEEDKENEAEESAKITAAQILLDLKNKYVDFSKNNQESVVAEQNTKNKKLTLMNLLITDDDLKVFTGINFALLENLKEAILICEKKPTQYGLSVKERIVLCLCKLKLNLTLKCLAILFNIRRQTCSNLFGVTVHTLAFILKSAIYWPSKEEIIHSMPKCFSRFSNTYIVLDCTEIPVERASCLRCRL